jgi:crotonobetainyl-CoA:carnitine CoA-transferase CaiB-like acyl-CoA transferase
MAQVDPEGLHPLGKPLAGLRVLDLTRVLSGPFASMLLGDMGAEIIKLEAPGGDETRAFPPLRQGESHYFLSVNRNKRSIVVDLRREEGRKIATDLVRISDVLIENFRPGVAGRLGLSPDVVTQINPRIVYCSISAFGQDGPWADRSAFDIVVQALSGAMSITGPVDGEPVRSGIPIADISAGMYAAIGVLGALVDVARTGKSHVVDVAMLDGVIGMLGYLAGAYLMTGQTPSRFGNGHPSIVPYGVYSAADGHVVIAVLTERFWPKLCEALGRPDLALDPRFNSNSKRIQERDAIEALVKDVIRTRSVRDWCDRLAAADVPYAPVLSVAEALGLEQTRRRRDVVAVDHAVLGTIDILGPVLKFDRVATAVAAPPALGQDTMDILMNDLRYPPDLVNQLCAGGIVQAASSACHPASQ